MSKIHIPVVLILCTFFTQQTVSTEQRTDVRMGSTLSTQEQEWLKMRKEHVKHALEELLNMSLTDDEVPRIALCCSGGGYRAMLATVGMLQGAHTPPKKAPITHLLHYISSLLYHSPAPLPLHIPTHTSQTATTPTLFDALSYCATLSGSTWALSSWLYSHMNIDAYCAQLAGNIEKGLMEDIDFTALKKTLVKKHAQHQSVSLVDVYGSLLAQKLLKNMGNNPYDTVLTEQQAYATSGQTPFLIYAALIGETTPNYEWIEATPYEIGSSYLHAWVPTAACGKKYKDGISNDPAAEQPLSFFLGMWGSGMCLTSEEFVEFIKPSIQQEVTTLEDDGQAFIHSIESTITSLVHSPKPAYPHTKNIFTTQRLSPARIHNWTYKLPGTGLNYLETITLVDAGIDFRIPTPPLLNKERQVDIIIVMDASDRALGTELRLSHAYAQRHKLPFPTINYQLVTQPFSVHGMGNTCGAPIIIYMPLVQNPKYHKGWDPRAAAFTSTYNFKYTKEQTYLLTGLTKCTMIEHQQDILNVIKAWIQEKRGQS